jgi:hypothetical protein
VIDPPAHPNNPNPLSEAPTQAPRKANKQGELKDNQKQKYWTIDQNFKLTKNNLTTLKGKTYRSFCRSNENSQTLLTQVDCMNYLI